MKILALDIGGSFIKYAQFEDGVLAEPGAIPTQADQGRKPCCVPSGTWQTSSRKNRQWNLVCQPDQPGGGCISSATETFPGFTGLQVKKLLERDLGVPVSIDNDVNCAAVGEGRLGAATGLPRLPLPDLWHRHWRSHYPWRKAALWADLCRR